MTNYEQQLKLKDRHLEQKVFQVRILFVEKFICRKIFGKNVKMSGKHFGMSEKFFEKISPPPLPSPTFPGKMFRCPFHSKSAPESLPPQVLDASYAQGRIQTDANDANASVKIEKSSCLK